MAKARKPAASAPHTHVWGRAGYTNTPSQRCQDAKCRATRYIIRYDLDPHYPNFTIPTIPVWSEPK
jgi:hypothetical protein